MVIHSAAERRPDVVEKQAEATQSLNVSATQFICQGASKYSCVWVCVCVRACARMHVSLVLFLSLCFWHVVFVCQVHVCVHTCG